MVKIYSFTSNILFMKRSLLFLFFFLTFFTCSAQKSWFIGGTANISYVNSFSFAVEPQFGYEINDRLAIGTGVGLLLESDYNYNILFGVAEPFIRFCAWHNERFFLDLKLTAGFGFTDILHLCQVGVRPSFRFRLSDHWDMSADIGLFGAQYTYSEGWRPAFGIQAANASLWFAYRF